MLCLERLCLFFNCRRKSWRLECRELRRFFKEYPLCWLVFLRLLTLLVYRLISFLLMVVILCWMTLLSVLRELIDSSRSVAEIVEVDV